LAVVFLDFLNDLQNLGVYLSRNLGLQNLKALKLGKT